MHMVTPQWAFLASLSESSARSPKHAVPKSRYKRSICVNWAGNQNDRDIILARIYELQLVVLRWHIKNDVQKKATHTAQVEKKKAEPPDPFVKKKGECVATSTICYEKPNW